MTNLRHFVKCLFHDSWLGVNASSQKNKLVSELGGGTKRNLRILNEKYKIHHINIDAP